MGLVVGASGAIGQACATALSGTVDRMVLVGRSEVRLAEAGRECGADSVPVVADITTGAGHAAVVDAVTSSGGVMRWAVFAAGVPLRGPLLELPAEDITDTFAANLSGPALLIQAIGRLAWAPRGSLVVIGSVSAARAIAQRTAYSASKAGIERMALSLAAEWAGRGVRVNVVSPGVIATPFLGSDRQHIDAWASERVPLGRCGRPSEVAEVVRYVTVDAPDYLLGARIVVDGGLEALL